MSELQGRVALVTGAASGIGRAAALRLGRAGARVVVADVDEAGEQTAREIAASGAEAMFARLDVTDEPGWRRTFEDAVGRWKRLDCLVNGAGISFTRDVTELSLEQWRRVLSDASRFVTGSELVIDGGFTAQ